VGDLVEDGVADELLLGHLEDVGHPLHQIGEGILGGRFALHEHLAAGRGQDPVAELGERRLARPVLTDDGQQLAGKCRQVDPGEDEVRLVCERDVSGLDHGFPGHAGAIRSGRTLRRLILRPEGSHQLVAGEGDLADRHARLT
jgi:hypothetical protein